MNERERERPQPARFTEAPSGEGDELAEARARADRLLRAVDAAIAHALSSNSEEYLQATRQSGGQ